MAFVSLVYASHNGNVMSIKFTKSYYKKEGRECVECESSIVTVTRLQLDYLVHSLGNYTDDTEHLQKFVIFYLANLMIC